MVTITIPDVAIGANQYLYMRREREKSQRHPMNWAAMNHPTILPRDNTSEYLDVNSGATHAVGNRGAVSRSIVAVFSNKIAKLSSKKEHFRTPAGVRRVRP